MTCFDEVFNKYLFYFLLSPAFDNYANDTQNSKGVAYPAINDARLYLATIALPPLAEQKRIVAKIEELLPLIDRYEQAWTRLEDFNKRFPVDMQKSILQMAIQGKLVEQRPEEGTGEELYQQIKTIENEETQPKKRGKGKNKILPIHAGRNLNQTIEAKDIRIRTRVDEPYVMRGTYHGLANGLKIGWHVDFIDRLKHLLERA